MSAYVVSSADFGAWLALSSVAPFDRLKRREAASARAFAIFDAIANLIDDC